MSVTILHAPTRQNLSRTAERARRDLGYAFLLLRVGFAVLPIVFWRRQVHRHTRAMGSLPGTWIVQTVPTTAHQTMLIVVSSRSSRVSPLH